MGLRWPGQGDGRGAPPGFPGTSQRPAPDPQPDLVEHELDVEPDPEPVRPLRDDRAVAALRAPTSPLRTGDGAGRGSRTSTVVRMSGFVSSRWPGLNSGETPVVLPLAYRAADDDPSDDVLGPPSPRPSRARIRSHVVVRRDPDADDDTDPGTEATVTPLPSLHERRSAETPSPAGTGSSPDDEGDSSDVPVVGGPGLVRRLSGPFQTVVAAVYAALADPLVNAPPEVREKRAIQVRRVGIAAAGTLLGCILVYAIFPVQTYLDLRSATQRAEEQRDALQRANDELEQRQRQLNEDETVEEIAREDYGMVFPGEESYGVLPAPETTTTTTPPTTPPD